jgi:hypothetical protein
VATGSGASHASEPSCSSVGWPTASAGHRSRRRGGWTPNACRAMPVRPGASSVRSDRAAPGRPADSQHKESKNAPGEMASNRRTEDRLTRLSSSSALPCGSRQPLSPLRAARATRPIRRDWPRRRRCGGGVGPRTTTTRDRRALREMPRAGFEPAAFPLGGGRSVQLSYRGACDVVEDTSASG